MSVSSFWKFVQRMFGLEKRTHYFDVPESIRDASHDSSNEVLMLRSEIYAHRQSNAVLRDLVRRMQQTLAERENADHAHHN